MNKVLGSIFLGMSIFGMQGESINFLDLPVATSIFYSTQRADRQLAGQEHNAVYEILMDSFDDNINKYGVDHLKDKAPTIKYIQIPGRLVYALSIYFTETDYPNSRLFVLRMSNIMATFMGSPVFDDKGELGKIYLELINNNDLIDHEVMVELVRDYVGSLVVKNQHLTTNNKIVELLSTYTITNTKELKTALHAIVDMLAKSDYFKKRLISSVKADNMSDQGRTEALTDEMLDKILSEIITINHREIDNFYDEESVVLDGWWIKNK